MYFYEEHLFGDITPYGAWAVTGYAFPLHFHRSFEIANVLEGRVILHIDEQCYEVNPGDTIIIFPNQLHSITACDHFDAKVILLQFSPDIVEQFVKKYTDLVPINNLMKNKSLPVPAVFTQNEFIQKGILYQLLGEFSEQTDFTTAHMTGNFRLLHQILSYIELHYTESCSLKDISQELGYDYSYLSRIFKQHIHLSYSRYLNNCRISHALNLLNASDLSISEIAFQCGFENSRNFNRVFLQQVGISPSQMRKQLHSNI